MALKRSYQYLIGCAVPVAIAIVCASSQACAAHFTTLYKFTNGTDGEQPIGGLVQDAAGVLYGTTSAGGNPTCKSNCTDAGTVFSLSKTSGLKTLVYFTGANGGNSANTLLLQGSTLYGASGQGASNDGVIFSVHTNGTGFTLLHQFSGADGTMPTGTPQMGTGGVLYGIANAGGPYGDGVLFSLAPDGTYTILHAFTGAADGSRPTSLLISSTGELFGSTSTGGADPSCSSYGGCGVVFNYTPATAVFTVQYTFGLLSGAGPMLGSIGPGPTIYGTVTPVPYTGVDQENVFSLGPNGFMTVINLSGFNASAAGDYPGPTLAPDGSLVLTAGPSNYGGNGELLDVKGGAIAGSLFLNGGSMGGSPTSQPIVTSTSSVYGTTEMYGKCTECGTIYQITQ